MIDSPDADAILAEVEKALHGGLSSGFEQKVAANAVALARRELKLGAASEAAELARLQRLLGRSGDLETVNRELCAALRERRMSAATPGLMDHLRRTAIEKIMIDQPSYPAFRAARGTQE